MNIQNVVQHLRSQLPDARAIYVFGSYVGGGFNAHSDLDVAVLLASKADPLALWHLAGELADIAGVPVDLIDLASASTVLQYQIVMKGRCVWAIDASAGIFEAFVLSEKTALDTARAGLLQDIQKDGVIHGR